MFGAKFIYQGDEPDIHYIIITDEDGIFDAFNFIADQLAVKGNAFLSLIYTVSEKNLHPLFRQEFSILERRYSERLIVDISRIDTKNVCFKHEILEATINSNTVPKMKFLVFGNTEFVNCVSGILRFLDVKNFLIISKTSKHIERQDSWGLYTKESDEILIQKKLK